MTVNVVRIVYGGIEPHAMHALKTETFLAGKKLTDANTLKGDCLVAVRCIFVGLYSVMSCHFESSRTFSLA